MNIGLVAVDGKNNFPNLALMKLSAWHKQRGDHVEWALPMFGRYDRVYCSKIFTFAKDDDTIWNCEVLRAGTGYGDYDTCLTEEQEHICPDYSLYPMLDYAIGFTTRGCVRKCPWCVVPVKEGYIKPHEDISNFIAGFKNIVLLDNNILASSHGIHQLIKCRDLGLHVDCNQGLDARFVDSEIAIILANIKWKNSCMRFAADTHEMVNIVKQAVNKLRAAGYNGYFFVYSLLTGEIHECVDRILQLKKHDDKIYINAQPYMDFIGINNIPQWQKDLARWCNRRELFKSVDIYKFMPRKGFVFGEYLRSNN